MLVTFLVFAAISCLGLLFLLFYISPINKKKGKSTVPGLSPSDDKDGNLGDIVAAGSFHQFLMELHREFGGIASFWFGQIYCVSLAEEKYFKDSIKLFNRPISLFEFVKPLIGEKSIQYANGEDGKRRHKIYSECFSHKVIMNGLLKEFNTVTEELIKNWSSLPEDEHIPLHTYMMALAVKLIAKTQFGTYFKSDNNIRNFHHLYEIVMSEMDELMIGSFTEKSNNQRYNKLQMKIQEFQTIVKSIVENQREAKESGDYNQAPFINSLLENSSDDEELISDAITFIVGGFHTTGNFLTWTLYYLTIYPEIQDKVRDEVQIVLGSKLEVSPEDILKLTYTQQVMEESLRCSKTAPFAAKVEFENDIRIGGHVIEPGTPIVHALGVSLNNEHIFKDPERFDPDRFNEENCKTRSNLSFVPFGIGQRKCPGYKFSRMEVLVAMAHLIRQFQFKLAFEHDYVVEPKFGFVTKPETEIWIKIKKIHP